MGWKWDRDSERRRLKAKRKFHVERKEEYQWMNESNEFNQWIEGHQAYGLNQANNHNNWWYILYLLGLKSNEPQPSALWSQLAFLMFIIWIICVHHLSTSFHMILVSGYSYFKMPVPLAMGILNEMILHMNGHASFIIIVILIINLMYCSLLCLDLDLDFCGLRYTNAFMNHHHFVCWSFLYTKISSLSSHYLKVIIWSLFKIFILLYEVIMNFDMF